MAELDKEFYRCVHNSAAERDLLILAARSMFATKYYIIHRIIY